MAEFAQSSLTRPRSESSLASDSTSSTVLHCPPGHIFKRPPTPVFYDDQPYYDELIPVARLLAEIYELDLDFDAQIWFKERATMVIAACFLHEWNKDKQDDHPFLRLPDVVLEDILGPFLTNSWEFAGQHGQEGPRAWSKTKMTMPILLTCKRFHRVATSTLYGGNVITLVVNNLKTELQTLGSSSRRTVIGSAAEANYLWRTSPHGPGSALNGGVGVIRMGMLYSMKRIPPAFPSGISQMSFKRIRKLEIYLQVPQEAVAPFAATPESQKAIAPLKKQLEKLNVVLRQLECIDALWVDLVHCHQPAFGRRVLLRQKQAWLQHRNEVIASLVAAAFLGLDNVKKIEFAATIDARSLGSFKANLEESFDREAFA